MDDQLLSLFQEIHDTAKDKGLIVDTVKEAIFKILKSKQGWFSWNIAVFFRKILIK